jgi:hypothetical protein
VTRWRRPIRGNTVEHPAGAGGQGRVEAALEHVGEDLPLGRRIRAYRRQIVLCERCRSYAVGKQRERDAAWQFDRRLAAG